jgi:nicotinamide-nucleotide amidase
MRAEIICVGSELLLGDIVDTNTQYLARRLSGLGIDLFFSTSVGDNLPRLVECLQRALSRSDLVLTSGGLGPTDDDLTREGIAALLGERLEVDESLAEHLRRCFALRGFEMTTNNLKQASLIPSARSIPNSRGTAPGWWVEKDGKVIVAMPGPPGELHNMWQTQVEPRLTGVGAAIRSRTLKAFNISESRVDELLKPVTPAANPTVAVYAKQDGIHIRITAKAENLGAAEKAISPVEAEVRRLLGDSIWGADDDTQESVALAMVASRGLSLAVCETITRGQLCAMLASAPGGDASFFGGLVLSYDDGDTRSATELATLARERFAADIAVGVAGRPKPGTDSPMDEVSVSVLMPGGAPVIEAVFRSRRQLVRTLGAYYALHELRRLLGSSA